MYLAEQGTVCCLLRRSKVGNASAIADIYAQRLLPYFGEIRWPVAFSLPYFLINIYRLTIFSTHNFISKPLILYIKEVDKD